MDQWLLVRLFEAGLLYQAEAPVTWCPSCLTVLAREQTETIAGEAVCERCATPVTERLLRQWFLRITAYADRLVDGLDDLDWPERAKRLQRQWIGRSEGRKITFPIQLGAISPKSRRDRAQTSVTVFTTRPETVLGVPAHDQRDARFAAEYGLPISDAPLLDDVDGIGVAAARYRLRDWLISRQRYWGPPIPMVHCDSCGPVAVPEDQLPVVLPDLDDFRPTGTGVSPLAASAEFVQASCPTCGGAARRETDVSDTFVDSAWYFLRYPSADFQDVPWDRERTAKFLPVDFYAGGPEHVQRHHLYARFITMALYTSGSCLSPNPSPASASAV